MLSADLPANESERLAALIKKRLLDTPAEAAFDDLAQLAALITGCPIALVSLVDRDRQWFKAKFGLDATETPREFAFCAHAILKPGELFQIPNALEDHRFQDNPFVVGAPDIRFYAGIPLMVPGNMPVGTLCVIDRVPKQLSPVQIDGLQRLARQLESQMEMRSLVADTQRIAAEAEQTKAALQASEVRFRTMSEASPLGKFVTDAAGSVQYLNPKWLEISGMSSDQALGDGWVHAIHTDDRPRVSTEWYQAARARLPYLSEHRFQRPNGEVIWTRVRAAEMLSDNGQTLGYVGTVEDISDSKKYEVELTRARDEALSAMRSKADFLATMSHEIRTPMNGVIGMTGLLLGSELQGQQREYVEIIQHCSESLLVLINDILDFSKIEAGALSLENTVFDPLQVIDESVSLLVERAQSKGIEINVRADPGLPSEINGDPGRLRQILVNLIGNAVKFTDRGSVEVYVLERNRHLGISITDTGIGMNSDALSRLFRPFSQADASTSRRFGGTGLGLVICKRLSEMMGGTIEVTSTVGVGSTFTFEFPAPTAPTPLRQSVSLAGAAIAIAPQLRSSIDSWIYAWGGTVVDLGQPAAASFYDSRTGDLPPINTTTQVLVSGLADRLSDQEVRTRGLAGCLTRPLRISAVIDVLNRITGHADLRTSKSFSFDRDLPQFVGRVLVADDNLVNIKVAAAFLRKIGLHSDATANGIETLVALHTAPYDLVLMDCQMPEMDGFAATTELRRRETRDGKVRIPVIALTANAMAGDREACLKAGMDSHLSKPIRIESLIEAVRPYLALKSAAASPAIHGFYVSDQPPTTQDKKNPADPPPREDLDLESIRQLLADLEDPDGLILPELETGFLEQSQEQIADLLGLAAIDDLPKLALVAHALKGQCLTLGLMTLADAMIRLEHHAQSGDAVACQQLAALVPALYQRACAALAQRIHG